MPEGHTIHRAAQDQSPLLVGTKPKIIAPDGRYTAEAKLITGRELTRIEPLGKHLFYHFDRPGRSTLHVHLALFGKLRLHKGEPPEAKGAIRYRLTTPKVALDLHGCRTADLLTPDEAQLIRDRIGPDPLDPKADAETVWQRISKSKAPIATLLMDQKVLSGVGNIYRAEVLFLHRVHPLTRGKELTRKQFDAIWAELVRLMKIGVKYNKIITISRDYAKDVHGKTFSRLSGRDRFYIYKADICPFSGGPVEKVELAGRTCWWSPQWQDGGGEA